MKKLVFLLALLMPFSLMAQNTGEIMGKIYSADGETVPSAHVILQRGDEQVATTTTDVDGNYNFSVVNVGTYDVKASSVAYGKTNANGVKVSSGAITNLDLTLLGNDLPELIIIWEDMKKPVSVTEPDHVHRIDADQIEASGHKSVIDLIGTHSAVNQDDAGDVIHVAGSRSYSLATYIDGMRVWDGMEIPLAAIAEVKLIIGGVPAKYGDATGGIVEITTKIPY